MLNKRDKTFVYLLIPVLFVLFIIWKMYKLLKEFWDDIQNWIKEMDTLM